MAKSGAALGIDIGQCALKALRCRAHEDDDKIVAEAFDYIEYPKILSQPDADPAELIKEALETFLSRNSVRGDKVAISVSGQSGLARFIKLPPVESKKIPDIVKYEAKQQIPFALEDVVWDYQQMAGGSEEDGFALETEVGLFAMKRDQVFRALKPLQDAGIEVDVIQLTPLTIYNYTVFDQMQSLPPPDQYDPENPPESVVVLSLGTDTTDLVVTNGYRVWQRSVPLGGSHFTKALMKELKLTFAKAEHLKKNATKAEDPKAVYQAMRPVFNDLLTEVQRSIGYFSRVDSTAKIGRVVALGNAMKMPGLQKYLSQNLGYTVTEVQQYRGLVGDSVVGEGAFKENLLSFAVCYGLALQGLGKSTLSTNLLPKEIKVDRMIRDKKPWAVGVVAVLLLGCMLNFLAHWRAWSSVRDDKFQGVFRQADDAISNVSAQKSAYETAEKAFESVAVMGENLQASATEDHLKWAEMLAALNQCLPHDPTDEDRPDAPDLRQELHIVEIKFDATPDLQGWYKQHAEDFRKLKLDMNGGKKPKAAPAAAPANPDDPQAGAEPAAAAAGGDQPSDNDPGPNGSGWVVTLYGYHFYNRERDTQGYFFLRDTLMKNLMDKRVRMPGADGEVHDVAIRDLGIGYPVMIGKDTDPEQVQIDNPDWVQGMDEGKRKIRVKRYDFTVQFAWGKPQAAPARRGGGGSGRRGNN